MAKTRRRAERTQAPAEHQRVKKGKKGGSYNWLVSQLRDKTFRIVIDFLTLIMAGGLLGTCCMCCANPSTAAAHYGLPPSKTAVALATTQRDGAVSAVALAVGCALEYRGKKGKEDNRLRIFSLILLLFCAVRWVLVLSGPLAKSWITMLDGHAGRDAQFHSMLQFIYMPMALVWCTQTAHQQRSMVTAPDFELAKMELQRLTSEDVLSRKQRSRIARIEYEAKKAQESNKKPKKTRKMSGTPASGIEPRSVASPAAANEVECDSDSGYSNSEDEEHSVAAKMPIMPLEDTEHELCSDCCVCLEEGAATRAVMPCRHLCLCADCENIGLELCPICREEITDIVQVADGDEDDYF